MQITTSWEQKGLERGLEREKSLILRQIKRKLGDISSPLETQIMGLNRVC